MMSNIISLIKSLGLSAEQLIAKKLIPTDKFEYMFDGDDEFYCEPENGLILTFNDASKMLISLTISLIPTDENDTHIYHGEMPQPFSLSMDRSKVRSEFGEPTEVTSATEIPTIGMVGGWDMYINKMNRLYPNIQIIFEYTAAQQVSELIFKINSKGSPE